MVKQVVGEKAKEAPEIEVKKTLDNAKILIGIPILAWTHEFATSFLKLWTELMLFESKDRKFQIGYEFTYRMPTALAEIHFAEVAIDSGCTHLLLMDDDIYDVTAVDILKLLDADVDVVGGIMHASGFPYSMCAFRRFDTKKTLAEQPKLEGPLRLYEVPIEERKGLAEVDLIPFACTLIKTPVFAKLKKPWFVNSPDAPTDSLFADQVLGAGLKYFAHFGVLLNHRGVTVYNRHLWHQMGLIEAERKKSNRLVILEPEELKQHEQFMIQKMKAAEAKRKQEQLKAIEFHQKG